MFPCRSARETSSTFGSLGPLYALADARREYAERAARGELSHQQAASVARQHRGKPKQKSRGTKQVFSAENGIKVTVSTAKIENYFEIEQSLLEAFEEVRHRINNHVQMFWRDSSHPKRSEKWRILTNNVSRDMLL